jgi:plasmid stability protein
MGNMSVRNLPEEVHDALKTRAVMNKRSAEAEVRAILIETIKADSEGGFGTRLRACFLDVEGNELDIPRDLTSAHAEPRE